MVASELACARCGRLTPAHRLSLWEQYEHYRVFQGSAQDGRAAQSGAETPASVYGRVRRRRAYLACETCLSRLQGGGKLDDLHDRRVLIYVVAVLVIGALVVAATPSALPALMAAFWRL